MGGLHRVIGSEMIRSYKQITIGHTCRSSAAYVVSVRPIGTVNPVDIRLPLSERAHGRFTATISYPPFFLFRVTIREHAPYGHC